MADSQKASGAYFTPIRVAKSLLNWAVRSEDDTLLDPSCGDGRFLEGHKKSVGIEQDVASAAAARERAPWALVHQGDFFTWASETVERFDCAAGNPPFIRYQRFKGEVRAAAFALCARVGVRFSGLTSSWAPFLVAAASLLKPGGRMSFVVPAEIGHAPYAAPLMDFLVRSFDVVHVVAVRRKLFPELSEDCWLLHAEGYGGATRQIRFSRLDIFASSRVPPRNYDVIDVDEWRANWNRRLRPYLAPSDVRSLYRDVSGHLLTVRLGGLADVGIGYVSGANDFFHLRPSEAERLEIPDALLHPSVRNGRALPARGVSRADVESWRQNDDQMLLLRLPKKGQLPKSVVRYLDTEAGQVARMAYKCRSREPWYSVPDVSIPDYFLTYMSGERPSLVHNGAGCTCTNSLHGVRLTSPGLVHYLEAWSSAFVALSTELEGHPLGGGMLKLEVREAERVVLPDASLLATLDSALIAAGTESLRGWRHHGEAS